MLSVLNKLKKIEDKYPSNFVRLVLWADGSGHVEIEKCDKNDIFFDTIDEFLNMDINLF